MRSKNEGRVKKFFTEQSKNENSPFLTGCKTANIPATHRQASKFLNRKGAAYKEYFKKSGRSLV